MRDTTCGRTVSHCEEASVSKTSRGPKGEVAQTNEIRRDRLRIRSVLDVAIGASEKSGQLVRFSVVRAAGAKVPCQHFFVWETRVPIGGGRTRPVWS